jgi:murein DD-endopeptidase MepM/ murein hydrolase activator NlpD
MNFVRLAGGLLVAASLLFSLPSAAQETSDGITVHVVQRGETLYQIAVRYGVTINDLARFNGLVNAGNIQVGQRLLVPEGDVPAVTLPSAHTVRPGETLRSIASFYGRTIEEIAALNEITNPNTIYVGQVLQIAPDAGESATVPSTLAATPEPTPIPTSVESPMIPIEPPVQEEVEPADQTRGETESLIHIVSRGETLFRIATRYGLTVNELARANSIGDPTLIYAGQRLIIPGFEVPDLALDLPEPFSSIDVTPQVLVEGKTARFRIRTHLPVLLSATFLGRELSVASDEERTLHTILQGIPLFTEAGVYPLELVTVEMNGGAAAAYTVNLQVTAGPYGREYIRLLAGRDGLLDTNVEQAELSLLEGVTAPFTEPRQFDGPMGLPAAATIISPFGTRRSYNGGPFDRFHSGTDFAGAPGTPVLATAPGRVVLADTLNVRGIATVIDHGWGIYTGYWHQSQQYVNVGDFVTTGQVIGTIGSTGRVTGAHLHWELWVGGVPVDPMQWVQFSFS